MKSKAPLVLMEQFIMILVFALTATVCLQVFVFASRTSSTGELRAHAVTAVQNAAESIKLCEGDWEKLTALQGGSTTDDGWQLAYDSNWQPTDSLKPAFTVRAARLPQQQPLLAGAEVEAYTPDGEELFRITLCWQEDAHE